MDGSTLTDQFYSDLKRRMRWWKRPWRRHFSRTQVVLAVAPGSTQSDATVIALAMWRTSFGGVNDFGLGSAIAVFLFVLVVPVLALNVRRFRREV